jgi:hypothetical protein
LNKKRKEKNLQLPYTCLPCVSVRVKVESTGEEKRERHNIKKKEKGSHNK